MHIDLNGSVWCATHRERPPILSPIVSRHDQNLRSDDERDLVERYLEGMAFIGKTDVQMSFELQGAAAFYMCSRSAMAAYGDWSRVEPYPDTLRRVVKERLPDFDDADLEKLISVGESPAPKEQNPAELAAYTMVASLLLNLDETLNKN